MEAVSKEFFPKEAFNHSPIYVILTDSPTLASEDMIHSKEVDMVRMGLRRSSSLFGVHYSTVRDYVFPLVDAAYCTLVIFVYIVLVL